jgi:hypothetical protein
MNWIEHARWCSYVGSVSDLNTDSHGCAFLTGWASTQDYLDLAKIVYDYKMREIAEYCELEMSKGTRRYRRSYQMQVMNEIRSILKHLTAYREPIPKSKKDQNSLQRAIATQLDSNNRPWFDYAELCGFDAMWDRLLAAVVFDSDTGLRWSGYFGGPVPPFDWILIWQDSEWGHNRIEQIREERESATDAICQQFDDYHMIQGQLVDDENGQFVQTGIARVQDMVWILGDQIRQFLDKILKYRNYVDA